MVDGKIFGLHLFVEESGIWPKHLLDAYIVLIPKEGGDAAPLADCWQLSGWVIFRTDSWLPDSVFSSGRGRSSVDAWYSTALDIEECFESDEDDHVHIFVADVVKNF